MTDKATEKIAILGRATVLIRIAPADLTRHLVPIIKLTHFGIHVAIFGRRFGIRCD